jgi:hypothetical protein
MSRGALVLLLQGGETPVPPLIGYLQEMASIPSNP